MFDAAMTLLEEALEDASAFVEGVLRALETVTRTYDRAFRTAIEASAERALVLKSVMENAPNGIGPGPRNDARDAPRGAHRAGGSANARRGDACFPDKR